MRDSASEAARLLAARGAQLVLGDFDDDASLAAAVAGVSGVFSVQLAPLATDPDSELRTARKLIDAAQAAKVRTFVHTSVARAGDHESFVGWQQGRWEPNYWESKAGVNDMVRSAGFANAVILKPAFMMDNYIPPKAAWMFPRLAQGSVSTVMAKGAKLDLIAAADIGRFAAVPFTEEGRFNGQEIDLAGDTLDTDEVAEIIGRATGKRVTAEHVTFAEAVAAGVIPGLASSQEWATVEGYKILPRPTRMASLSRPSKTGPCDIGRISSSTWTETSRRRYAATWSSVHFPPRTPSHRRKSR